jgi:hypothetical protein
MKHFSSGMMASALTLLIVAGCSQPAQPTAAPPQQPEPTPIFTQENGPSKASLEIKTLQEEMKLKSYEAKEYGFQIRYPETWEVKDKVKDGMGIIVTSNDDPSDKQWGGTSLNIHVTAQDGDWDMGWESVKTDKYVNLAGTTFGLTYMEPDPTFAGSISADARVIGITTKLVSGPIRFSYDAKKNPDAENQLKLLLENFIPMN